MTANVRLGEELRVELGMSPVEWHKPPHCEVFGKTLVFRDLRGEPISAEFELQYVERHGIVYYVYTPRLHGSGAAT